ncbi:MAG: efflux transporter outer membrane subunit [Burkholderiales bacterium]|jgi:multidrug efflux system outer membrane protein
MLALAALLAACAASSPQPEPPVVTPPLPAGWGGPVAPAASLAERPWGALFRNGEIEALIDEALRNNRDLRIAAERIEIARAQYGIARAALVPSVGADASVTSQRGPTAFDPDSNRRGESYRAGLAVPAWEIDLWGRIRSLSDAALRNVEATESQRRFVEISLIAQVAQQYLDLLEVDQQLAVSRRTAQTRRDGLRLVQLRFDAGVVSMVDVTQAQSSLAQAEQAIAALERRRSLGEHALSLLIGRNPGPLPRTRTLEEVAFPSELPAGIPSDLLRRRPDIIAAERVVAASAADVDAARKAFLPTVSLTGFLGVISPQLSQLLDAGRAGYAVTPAITLPLFTGGRLDANLDGAAARQRIAIDEYGRSVQGALREVEDALVSFQRRREERAALERLVAANRERLRLVDLRYITGISSYFEVLDSQRVLFDSELSLAQATAATYASVIQLYRALGGGWDPGPVQAAAPAAR